MRVTPKISIVTAVYNGEAYLEECIDSVLRQRYPNLEYILVDGGSKDRSVEIIQKFSNHLSYWTSEKDSGMYDALNKGFKRSTGEIMAWLNADDILMPKSLFLISDLFARYPEAEWIQGLPLKLSSQGYVFGHFRQSGCRYDYYLKRYGRKEVPFIQQESTFWKRSLWERAGGYLDSQYKLAGDFELWMRFFEQGVLYNTGGLVGAFRIRDGQLSQDRKGYLDECEAIIDAVVKRLPAASLKHLKRYKTLLDLQKIPFVSRLSRRLFRDFYHEEIDPKFLK